MISPALAAALAWAVLPGCAPEAPPARIACHVGSRRDMLRLHRVALVTLACEEEYAGIGEGMTQALFQAVQQRKLFHLRVVRPDDLRYAEGDLPIGRPCRLEELSAMRKALNCNAVLLGSINHFRPYPRMQMGLYLRLIDLRGGRLLWAVDHTWDTAEKNIEARMKDFFAENARSGYDPLHWRVGMLSPRAFGKFVAHEAAATLPSGEPPPAAADRPAGPLRWTLDKIAKMPRNISRAYGSSRQ